MAVRDRLIGADASLYKASFGSTLTSGVMTAGSFYKIVTTSGTTTFATGYLAGDLFLGDGIKTMNAGNTAALATFTIVQDCSGFDMAFSADEVEVTVLADDIKKYRKGKTDLSGTINGINIVSEMKKAGSLLNKFIRTVSATAASVSTLTALDASDYYGIFYLQDDTTTAGETNAFLCGQIEVLSYNLGAAVADTQSYDASFRFINNDPIVYFKANS
jgi:hypothetical protein